MKTDYYIVDPTQNITLLIEGAVPACDRARVAGNLMRLEPAAEQAGFISAGMAQDGTDICLNMAGGEFCGNAAMSAAALYCRKADLQPGAETAVMVGVSGTERPVKVEIEVTDSEKYRGTVYMPPVKSLELMDFEYDGTRYRLPLVNFGGISHIIAEELHDRDAAEKAVKLWCGRLKADALGLMLFDRAQSRLDPLVYVPGADTLFWESSCASGTTAVGAWLAHESGVPVSLKLREPGGELGISAIPAGASVGSANTAGELKLTGHVRILRHGEAEI